MDQGQVNGGHHEASHASQAAMNNNTQPAFVGWAAQPLTAYQLVPMDSNCIGYRPIYTQQPAALYTFPTAMAVTPMSPTGKPFLTPISPVRRHASVGLVQTPASNGGFYPPTQPQCQHTSCQQQPQIQAAAAMQSMSSQAPVSPEATRALHFSPVHGTPQPYPSGMAFATPPPARHASVEAFQDLPPQPPATLPRLAPRQSSRMMRPNRPKPLSFASAHFRRDGIRTLSHPAHPMPPVVPSVTPVGSDREYDGGDSSYSTSPLRSERYNDNGNNNVFGMVSETSTGSRFAPQMPRYVCTPVMEEPPSPTPRFRTLRRHRKGRLGLEQCIEDRASEKQTAFSDAPSVGLSSSDEWYTTSDANPVRSGHRHQVSEEEAAPSGPGLCNCGMQKCCNCGLFISQPEKHVCINDIVPTNES